MRQQGSALLVSLVLLVMLTFTGLAAINSSSLEEKVTGNFRDLQTAFRVAEAGLLEAEQRVQETDVDLTEFTPACQQGLCFFGNIPEDVANCRAGSSTPWRDASLWQDADRTRELVISLNGEQFKANYIVEFRCYLPRDADDPDPDVANINDWSQFYRITVKAYGNKGSANVMLQTTYTK